MKWHKLKTVTPVWKDVDSGVKSFEIREDDRGYAVGDILELQEYDERVGWYTSRVCYREVTYILRPEDVPFKVPLMKGGCVMAIAPLTREEANQKLRESEEA